MKNTTKKLALVLCLLVIATQVNANNAQDVADKISRLAWTTVQEKTLTKTDSIAKIAWNQKDTFESPKQEENLVACAADLEEQANPDKISRLAWTTVQEKTLTKTDSIAKMAWNQKDTFENPKQEENLVACAADLEEQDTADRITKKAWAL